VSRVVLRVENIVKTFGKTIAVNDVSFEVYERELFTLLGPSGCGKTTTLRVIAGLERPDRGRVYIDGVDVTDLPPKDRNVCLVFQEYAVFPHMSVYDNIAFGLKAKRISKLDIDNRVREVAELLDLQKVLWQKAGKISLSEQQRTAMARCIVIEPKLLLLDEPLSLVDAKIRERMRRELRKMQRDLGVTMVFVTHDQLEALMLSDRIAVMREGKLIQVGRPQEIYDNPINLFVASFIGSPTMNFLEGVLRVVKDKLILESDVIIELMRGIDTSLYSQLDGKKVIVGFRPEDAFISPEGLIKGVIQYTEIAGDKKIIHLRVSDKCSIRVFVDLYALVEVGDVASIQVNPLRLHIFDKETGNKLLRAGV
jgi:multiple sugar transport system ATP-binding protein